MVLHFDIRTTLLLVLTGVIMPTVGLGSSGGCHPDPDGTEDKCGNYNASLSAMSLGYRAFHDALS